MIGDFMFKMCTVLLLVIACVGCSVYDSTSRKIANSITPYKIDIIQGQPITKEQFSQVKVGMKKIDVQLILGSPSVQSFLANNEWKYVFFYRNGNSEIVKRTQVNLTFSEDVLKDIQANELPSEIDLIKQIDKNK